MHVSTGNSTRKGIWKIRGRVLELTRSCDACDAMDNGEGDKGADDDGDG